MSGQDDADSAERERWVPPPDDPDDEWSRRRPLSDPMRIPAPRRHWGDEDWKKILLGYKPGTVDDRLYAWVEDACLYIHHSWSGDRLYEARFERDRRGWHIVEACADHSNGLYPGHYPSGESLELEGLINWVLVNRESPRSWKRRTTYLYYRNRMWRFHN